MRIGAKALEDRRSKGKFDGCGEALVGEGSKDTGAWTHLTFYDQTGAVYLR